MKLKTQSLRFLERVRLAHMKTQKTRKRFVIENNHDDTAGQLCSVCKTIDFQAVFKLQASEVSEYGMSVFPLDDRQLQSSQTSCPACGMFASMADPTGLSHARAFAVWQLRAFPVTSLWGTETTEALPYWGGDCVHKSCGIVGLRLSSNE